MGDHKGRPYATFYYLKIVCEELLEFQPKSKDDSFAYKQKSVRLQFIGGVYFCALQSPKLFGVKKFLSDEQTIFKILCFILFSVLVDGNHHGESALHL